MTAEAGIATGGVAAVTVRGIAISLVARAQGGEGHGNEKEQDRRRTRAFSHWSTP
jgi:hypothetical protein